jgi:DNA-binding SARP family transcriptional activator
MEIRVLGELEVLDRGRRAGPSDLGGRKPKQVLELLALARGRPVPKETLIERLWPDRPPRHPVAALENHIWVLRRHLGQGTATGEQVVLAEAGAYRLAVERVTLDLVRFDELLREASGKPPSDARGYLELALSLVRGDLFEDEPYADWVGPSREEYRVRVATLELDLAEAALADGSPEVAVELAGRVLDEEPLSERACRLKMLGLVQQGDRVRALRLFGSFRDSLRAELAIEPMTETWSVYEAVRGGPTRTPQRITVTEPPPAEASPGPARPDARPASSSELLRPALIGRAAELHSLVEEVQRTSEGHFRLVLLEGLAHVGKSALVHEALARSGPVARGWARFAVPSRGLPYLLLHAALQDAVGQVPAPSRAGPALAPLELIGRKLRRHAPVVLVLDDLHHADLHAIRALSNLQVHCSDVPVVTVGVFRSEEVAYGHPLRSLRPAVHLRLEPLTCADLDGVGGAAAFRRTGGYGAYLPTWLGGARMGPPAGELLTAVLGRCEASGARAHRILTVASALPQPFDPPAVAAATGIGVHRVAEHLDRLTARGLLRDLGSGGFEFVASLVSDALRGQVSDARRQLIRHGHAALTGTGPR